MRAYYWLAKPGIVYGNALTLIGGFLFAAEWDIDPGLFLATVGGTCLVMASSCVFNNYIDRNIDKKMARTKWRATANGKVSGGAALIYGTILGVLGFGTLLLWTNALTALIGVIAFIDYVALYGWLKRRSFHGTLAGTIAGSAPPVAGYCAVTGRFDLGALIIFLIMLCWQMTHFYAIAIRRSKDYKAAGIPVLPLVKGVRHTKIQMILYTIGFILGIIWLTAAGYAGDIFLVVMVAFGVMWLRRGLTSFNIKDNVLWAKQMFMFSLVVLLAFSVMLSVGSTLP
ncbi:MAG TPA: heme o synthase [Candidatus Saccharimonadales bacterium]|nr:heme o synthase [Candidatus Saccharimonadales bacterium]